MKSALIIDNNFIDNFVNSKILKNGGVNNIKVFHSTNKALSYLKKTDIKYEVILLDIHMPVIDGFDFIDKFNELDLCMKQGEICLLTCSINPEDKLKANYKNIKFIEKPLTMEKLFRIEN